MKSIKIPFCFVLFSILMLTKTNAQMSDSKTGAFDSFSDIGSPEIKGIVSYEKEDQRYRISGSGSNIWFGSDSFSFLWKKMNGDFMVQTQVRFIGDGHEPHRKTGIMVRSSSSASSPMLACTVHGDGLTTLQWRKTEGADVEETKMSMSAPDVLQIEKKGNSFIMSAAHFGEVYQTVSIDRVELGDDVSAGLYVCSHNNNFSEEVEFNNTRIFNTAPNDLVQYTDYLGSLLEVMDVETGQRKVVASDEGSWQAPNWTPDGKTLIYNASGKLYNFDLKTRKSSVLNTDFADNNNNDHVLSFDGKQMGISHHAKDSNGQSAVYTLPINGGVPKRITKDSPSYLHGWSPDNRFLIYTAERNGSFNIFKISTEGGEEIQLTDTPGLEDGSEYSPDGKYIYFCSTRTGTMQVWRMDADGENQTQLTFDEFNDWFPHVSPDKKSLVFVSFPKEVPAGKHPFYESVYLRIMPIDGGKPKVIAYVYGGQGTINVPSWSPDGKKIAFVSNGIFVK